MTNLLVAINELFNLFQADCKIISSSDKNIKWKIFLEKKIWKSRIESRIENEKFEKIINLSGTLVLELKHSDVQESKTAVNFYFDICGENERNYANSFLNQISQKLKKKF